MADDKKVIFSMSKLSKTYQGADKPVLKNIYLSFFYGAKIGILGLNGSGKSSLLKIIAGVDKNYQGDVVFAPGYTVGYLEQEPILDDSKTVIEIVRLNASCQCLENPSNGKETNSNRYKSPTCNISITVNS